MRWFAPGRFLGAKRWGDKFIGCVVARDQGMWMGLIHSRPPLLGSEVQASWSARDPASLGSLRLEETSFLPSRDNMHLVGVCEAVLKWCDEREAKIYPLVEPYFHQLDKKGLLSLLSAILRQCWGAEVEERWCAIVKTAVEMDLPRLPTCSYLLETARSAGFS